MSLIFRIVNVDNPSSPSVMQYEWSELGGTLGRSAANDWVLPDNTRFLSAKHALIKYQNGHYYITDTSTNGVFIDQNPVPLGKDNSVRLKNGNVLKLGEYEIEVLLESDNESLLIPDVTLIESVSKSDSLGIKKPIPGGQLSATQDQDPFAYPKTSANKENISLIDKYNNETFDSTEDLISDNETQYLSESVSLQDDTELVSNPRKKTPAPTLKINREEQNMAAFLRGVGLYDEETQQKVSQHLEMEKVGQLFRLLLQGSMDVLKTRTEIKNEMRVELTTIQPIENNPVKFSVDVDDALGRIFAAPNPAFMPVEQAFRETFDDIKTHQVAIIAGTQSSLRHIFKRFDPDKLVSKLEKQSPVSAKVPMHRQAKLWGLFEDLYTTVGEEAADDFQHLFGVEFSRAYEKQIAQLELSRMLKKQ